MPDDYVKDHVIIYTRILRQIILILWTIRIIDYDCYEQYANSIHDYISFYKELRNDCYCHHHCFIIILISFKIIIVIIITIIIAIIIISTILRNINLQNLRRASAFIDVMDRKVDRVRNDTTMIAENDKD